MLKIQVILRTLDHLSIKTQEYYNLKLFVKMEKKDFYY